jgi:hypothetical protein
MFDKQQRKLKRSARLISVLSKYGFKDLLARMNGGNKEKFQPIQMKSFQGNCLRKNPARFGRAGTYFCKARTVIQQQGRSSSAGTYSGTAETSGQSGNG